MEWNKKNNMDFIELYRKKSIIWDPQESDHYNKIKKQDAWVEIAEDIGKPVEECKKKMENLLASLRREKMKIKKHFLKYLLLTLVLSHNLYPFFPTSLASVGLSPVTISIKPFPFNITEV
ncbi:hypothetical protein RI129_003243 [Pyrocoelia pectoralis]|uniref:MADF domain-containing protein n=1 Tax=Pyrocoelia pectoralis TaxID=417401 RepID=A0AAN7ZUD0_9COLE